MRFANSGTLALTGVAFLAAAAMTVGYPRVSEPRLGAVWQCSRVAFLFTSCSQIKRKAEMVSRATVAEAPVGGTALRGWAQ